MSRRGCNNNNRRLVTLCRCLNVVLQREVNVFFARLQCGNKIIITIIIDNVEVHYY